MHTMSRQRGMTTIGWLLVLALIGFFALILVRLAPAYMEYYSVVSVFDGLREEPFISSKPVPDIRKLIGRRFDVNNVSTVKAGAVRIERRAGELVLTAKYEKRVPLIANIDVVTRFHKQTAIPMR